MPQTRGDMKMEKSVGESNEDLIKKICTTVVSQLTGKLDEVDNKLSSMDKKFNDKLSKLDKLDDLDAKLVNLTKSVSTLGNDVSNNSLAVKQMSGRLDTCEQHTKSNSLRFYGIEEKGAENVPELISSFINDALNVRCCVADINFAFRVGKLDPKIERPRPILVNFVNNWKRSNVYSSRKMLKKSELKISIFEDLTRKRYQTLLTAKNKFGKDKAWSSGGNIYFLKDGKKCLFNLDNE